MTTAPGTTSRSFLGALAGKIENAAAYNRQDQAPPVAVLWPDKDRQWAAILPRLAERLPIFALGQYAPEQRAGPAYWLRCIIARTIAHAALPDGVVPVLYLPGYSRQDVRAVEDCPRALQPLAELQYRGVLWTQRNGRDWTVEAFLRSRDGGLGIDVSTDTATREALTRALPKLADVPVTELHREAPIRAQYLDDLLHPDDVKAVLRWLNDPPAFHKACSPDEWSAFVALCRDRYKFHPVKDGPIDAARLLARRGGPWAITWQRFAEAPAAYTALPEVLRQARPTQQLSLTGASEVWPQDNDAAEERLRGALTGLAAVDASTARAAVLDLEQEHGSRRAWVWATLGRAPLARALEHLVALAQETAHPVAGTSVDEVAQWYAERGWQADAAVLRGLASVEAAGDLAAVSATIRTIYRPWLEASATALQKAVASGDPSQTYVATPSPSLSDGMCLLFSDGLRYDAAQSLLAALRARGLECAISHGLAALPSVTETAKYAISPVASAFAGRTSATLNPVISCSGSKVNVTVLRKALVDMGIQVLRGEEVGDATGRAWTELGRVDEYGHEHGLRVAHHLEAELRTLERRIHALLEHGWQSVVVITDHGWLLLPGGLPKADLPLHLTEGRKGRCARLKPGANVDLQTVPWRWDSSVRIAVAPGIHCFEAGKDYEHGGLSPQECVVPITTVGRAAPPEAPVVIESVKWRRLRCRVTVSGGRPGIRVDLRTKAGDPATSLVSGGKDLDPDGSVSLLVEDEDREGDGAVVVLLGQDSIPRAQEGTVIGGTDQ